MITNIDIIIKVIIQQNMNHIFHNENNYCWKYD